MSQPSLLIVTPYGFTDRLANYIESTTARLLVRKSWDVRVLTRYERDAIPERALRGVRLSRYTTILQGFLLLVRTVASERPDIMHVHNLRNNQIGILAAMCARLLSIPLVFTEYGLGHDHYLAVDRDEPFAHPLQYEHVVTSLSSLIKRAVTAPTKVFIHTRSYFFHWALSHADHVVFVSKHNLPIAKQLGIHKTHLLPYLLDESRWSAAGETPSATDAADAIHEIHGPFALFVGQMKRRKGWDVFIRAAAQVTPAILRTFVLVTPSRDTSSERLLQELGLGERIVVMHRLEARVLHELYMRASMVVVPSLYEGFGLAPVEAFEAERPVIASNVEALSDYLRDGVNAILVEPNRPADLAVAMERVANDPKLAHTLVKGGTDTLASFRSEATQREWLSFYESLLERDTAS